MNEKYSVLMSIYDKENPEFFRQSIISVLNQTVKPDQIVIVKDGKLNEKLESVFTEFVSERIFTIVELNENKGLGEALNIGINYCVNDLVARMDTDDIAREDRFECQLNEFKKNKHLDIIGSNILEFSNDIKNIISLKRVPLTHNEIVRYSKKRNPFNHPAVMYKKSKVLEAGGYKHFEFFEDYYLWIRMINVGAQCKNIDEPLVYMRANDTLFERRGGYNYLKCMAKFKWHLRSINYYSNIDFLTSFFSHALVSLFPNKVRKKIYITLLRKKI